MKSIRPVKSWVIRCWCGYLSSARCKWFPCGLAAAAASGLDDGRLPRRPRFDLMMWWRLPSQSCSTLTEDHRLHLGTGKTATLTCVFQCCVRMYVGKIYTWWMTLHTNGQKREQTGLTRGYAMVVYRRPKTPKIEVFLGSPSPHGSHSPYILGDTTRPGHVTCVLVWSKSHRRRLRKTLHKQTKKRQTDTTKIMVTCPWTNKYIRNSEISWQQQKPTRSRNVDIYRTVDCSMTLHFALFINSDVESESTVLQS